MSETKLATVRFGIQSDVIDDTEIQNLIESYHREYISIKPLIYHIVWPICSTPYVPYHIAYIICFISMVSYHMVSVTG